MKKSLFLQWLPWFAAALCLSIIPGQMVRFEIHSGGSGILVADIVTIVLILPWVAGIVWKKRYPNDQASRLLTIWIITIILSWFFAAFHNGTGAVVTAAAYVIRLIAYLSVFGFAYRYAGSLRDKYKEYAVLTAIILLGFGWLILVYLPNFAPLTANGWDPHIDRLTSTWLDPNYFGTYLALVFAAVISWEQSLIRERGKWLAMTAVLLLCGIGIYATISRSALLTLIVAAGVASLRTSWRAVLLTGLVVITLLLVPSRLHNRINTSLSYVGSSSGASTEENASSVDPTANARVESWKKAWALTKKEPVFGVGYNYYQDSLLRYGFLDESSETRGTSGSDSSILTLLATTGFIGLAACLAFFGYLMAEFWKHKTMWTTAGLAVLSGLLVGCQFNNALLYPLILLPVMLLLGIAHAEAKHQS